jgi:hypothetical protein
MITVNPRKNNRKNPSFYLKKFYFGQFLLIFIRKYGKITISWGSG